MPIYKPLPTKRLRLIKALLDLHFKDFNDKSDSLDSVAVHKRVVNITYLQKKLKPYRNA